VSSELERLLREGREVLPEPDAAATRRARARALTALRGRPTRRVRVAAMVTSALVIAAGIGVGIGSFIAPSSEAAKGPVGLGFLPEPGWYTFQAGGEASPVFQTIAVASNLPLEPEDVVAGAAEPSGLPYATLLGLPPNGVVVVASFTRRSEPSPELDRLFRARQLPLRLRDGTAYDKYTAQVRADEPLGQIHLRAAVNGHDVDVTAYFGTPRPSRGLLASAQRQLDRLVVSSEPKPAPAAARVVGKAQSVVDRTYLCTTGLVGGLYEVEARAHAGVRPGGSAWKQLPFAVVASGNSGGRANDPELLANSLSWITAAKPSSTTTMDSEWRSSLVRSSGTLALNGTACKKSNVRVPLSAAGLRGGAATPNGKKVSCESPRRVLVRVRATLEPPATLTATRGFLRTQATVRAARLAVRTPSGKQLVYANVADSGKARLFTARSCEEG